ncbi:MAG TPA: TMEM43 family protein [Chthoniobacterales bacterium]|nr:TMEM43 family protein [Chthoniobacterales bacterium]
MADTFTTVSSTSLFGRIRDAFLGFIIGPLLLVAAVILIFWNESHSVRVLKSLKEGAAKVVEADEFDSDNDGELVHVTGDTTTEQTLQDPVFGVTAQGIRLSRNVQVYAWTEKESTSSSTSATGTKTTKKTYSYEKKWVSSLPNSNHFKQPEGHENPAQVKYKSASFQADNVALGDYALDPELVGKLTNEKSVSIEKDSLKLPDGAQVSGDTIYIGSDAQNNPAVGDLRIAERIVPNGPVSVVAGQGPKERLAPFQTQAGETIGLIEPGNKTAAEMFANARSANRTFTWVARIGGLLLLLFGFLLLLSPLSTMSSIVPFLGGIFEAGVFLISLLAAIAIWALLVALAWMVARPLIGGAMLALAAAGIFLLIHHIRKGAARRQARPASAPA